MREELRSHGTQPLKQIFACFPTCDDPKNYHPHAMKIECHQFEYVVLHIIGAKHGNHKNNPIVIKLENGQTLLNV
jgi:hypothetical protein